MEFGVVWARVCLAVCAGLFVVAGVHAFWAVKIADLGGGLGAAAGVLFAAMVAGRVGALMLALAYGTDRSGNAWFAESYAEDALAGKM